METPFYIMLGVILVFNLFIQVKLIISSYLNIKRKLLNTLLLWTIPIIWAAILFAYLSKRKTIKVMIKSNRKIEYTGFYESGKGIGG